MVCYFDVASDQLNAPPHNSHSNSEKKAVSKFEKFSTA
jgi:hypothetical protein